MIFKRETPPGFAESRAWWSTGACAVTRGREETLRMLSIPDMAILGAVALIVFGPDQLPRVARKAGLFMRDVQNTSQAFIREMGRAADEHEPGDQVARAHLLDEASSYTPPYTPPYTPYETETSPHEVPLPLDIPPAGPLPPHIEHAAANGEVSSPTHQPPP